MTKYEMAIDPDEYIINKRPLPKAKTLDDARKIARNYCIKNKVWDGIVIFCNSSPSGIVIPRDEMVASRKSPLKDYFGSSDGTKRGLGTFIQKIYWNPYKSNKEYLIHPDGSIEKK